MSVSMGNSHTDRMFKTMAQNKEKRRECCNKIWSPENYVALENDVKKPGKGSIVIFLPKLLQR